MIQKLRHYAGNVQRYLWRYYESLFPQLTINEELLIKAREDFSLDQTTDQLKKCYNSLSLRESDNKIYFNNLLHYVEVDKFLPNNPFFLYPPNVAVIDFLLKNVKKEDRILDYACGLGNLQIYLRKLGFHNTFGYDNFDQIDQSTIQAFVQQFGFQNVLLSKEQALTLQENVLTCIGWWWKRIDKSFLNEKLKNPALRTILIETRYAPRYIKGFRIMGVYKDLIIVFQRRKHAK